MLMASPSTLHSLSPLSQVDDVPEMPSARPAGRKKLAGNLLFSFTPFPSVMTLTTFFHVAVRTHIYRSTIKQLDVHALEIAHHMSAMKTQVELTRVSEET